MAPHETREPAWEPMCPVAGARWRSLACARAYCATKACRPSAANTRAPGTAGMRHTAQVMRTLSCVKVRSCQADAATAEQRAHASRHSAMLRRIARRLRSQQRLRCGPWVATRNAVSLPPPSKPCQHTAFCEHVPTMNLPTLWPRPTHASPGANPRFIMLDTCRGISY